MTGENWREVARLEVARTQDEFVRPAAYYVALAQFEDDWSAVAFRDDDLLVGVCAFSVDPNDGSHWVDGFQIDRHHQRQGVGRDALEALLAWLSEEQGADRVTIAYDGANEAARALLTSEGFVESGEDDEGRIVARRSLSS